MKVWLYYRLSRDEDAELNSLTNQKNILIEYANTQGYDIVGESFDDNVSGMHFNREGINQIYEQVEQKTIDAVVVKTYPVSEDTEHRQQCLLIICERMMSEYCPSPKISTLQTKKMTYSLVSKAS